MLTRRFGTTCARLALAGLAAAGLFAAQHHGTVKSGRFAVPGATVTGARGEARLATTTDADGAYSFADLADGIWTIEVEMLGFESAKREIGIAPGAPNPEWNLRLLAEGELVPALSLKPGVAAGPASRPALPEPGREARPAQNGRGGRGAQGGSGLAFQQVGINQSADLSLFGQEGAITNEMNAELSPSANQALIVQGSMSSAMGLPGRDDLGPFGGRGMPGGPEMMAGAAGAPGPGGMPGMGAEGTAAAGEQPAGMSAGGGGRGGPGAPGGGAGPMMAGGGPGGGPGGPGGGPMGGGPMMDGGGRGGAGGRGGPGGPRPWMSMNNALAFGNNRRNPRMMYTGNLAINEGNSLLNAQSYSLTGQNIEKPYSNTTSVNASFGGPLKIPKLLSGNRGQFTLNAGVTRSRNGQQGTLTTMPSALERSGDFSQSAGSNGGAVVLYDPTTGQPFPGNRIPASRMDPIAASLLSFYPDPNLPGQTRNFQLPTTRFANSDNLNARVNQTLGSKDRISGGIGYSGSNNTNPSIFGFTDKGSGRGINANVSYSHNFTGRTTASLNYTFSRNRNLFSPFFAYQYDIAGALGIQGVSTDPLNWGPPNLNFSNFAALSDGAASLARMQTSSVGGSLMWVRKTHNFSFGTDFRRQQNNRKSDANGRGSFTFNGYATSQMANGAATAGTGFDLADFLLGMPDTATVGYGNSSLYFRGSSFDIYMQDDWRVSSRFSLVFGVRWDYQTPVRELHNRIVNLAVAPNFTGITAVQPGEVDALTGKPYPAALMRSDPNNISPRIGIAWRPSARASTVLRAGYGLYYNTSVYANIASQMAQQPPLATVWNLNIQNSPQLSMADAFTNPANLATNSLTTNTFAADPNYRVGYVQQWNFSIQQDLPYSFQASVTYLGSRGTDLDRQFQPWVTAPNAEKSPYPTGYTYETYGGNSIYHAGSIQLMRRFRGGFRAAGSYTFSKSIDSGGAGGGVQAQNWLDFRAERGLSSFDQRHSVNIDFSYGAGQGRRGGGLVSGWKGRLLQDWSIMSQIQVHNTNPMTATVGGNQVSAGSVSQTLRADATGTALEPAPAGQLFNPAAFAAPAAGLWGNAGRNTIPGPMLVSLNASAGRVFRFGERRSADLQVRANNALNTVVINRWNTQLNTNTFGQPTGVSAMRTITASLRFRF
ncbi:MAG: TonB-dependent receptor [Acidobacteriia bacterium]|nr:TonB-dependent receptor [Terriglobia bacterium]